MKYTELLLKHPDYLKLMDQITGWEQERIYCHHELEHALDVCRIAWTMYLECHAGQPISQDALEEKKDLFYITGLLHDVGRTAQYAGEEHHASAGVRLSEKILADLCYPEEKKAEVLATIGLHPGRNYAEPEEDSLAYYIFQADHLSRNCFACKAVDSCKWSEEERNQTILY